MVKNKKTNNKLISLVVKVVSFSLIAVALILGAIQIINRVPSVKNTLELATTVKAETFTELYFEDHLNLPKTIEKYKFYNFTFTIHNLENKDMEYPYVVYLQTVDKKIILNQNTVSVKSGEYGSIYEDFGPLKNIRMKFVVELVDKNQSIHFWMEANEQGW
jgi:hypothetical protein